nr:hypothetical protein Q903MT_gene866 [Picea sitchensis]
MNLRRYSHRPRMGGMALLGPAGWHLDLEYLLLKPTLYLYLTVTNRAGHPSLSTRLPIPLLC